MISYAINKCVYLLNQNVHWLLVTAAAIMIVMTI